MVYIIIYFVIINLLAFCMYGIDKQKAVRGKWRIPEKTLLFLAVIGGSVGAFFGIRLFHHKTKHPKFYIGVPLIFVVQAVVAAAFLTYGII